MHGAHGVVVSHPLRMRKALGSNPSVSNYNVRDDALFALGPRNCLPSYSQGLSTADAHSLPKHCPPQDTLALPIFTKSSHFCS